MGNNSKDETGALLEASNTILERCKSRNSESTTKSGMSEKVKAGIGMVVNQRRLSTFLGEEEGKNSRYAHYF